MKKPIFKRWWFWLIVVVLVLGAIGAMQDQGSAGGEQKQEKKAESEPEVKPESKEEAKPKAEKKTTPEDRIRTAVHKAFGNKNDFNGKDSIKDLSLSGGMLAIEVYGNDNLTTGFIRAGILGDVKSSLKAISKEQDVKEVMYNIWLPMQDSYGNESDRVAMTLGYKRPTMDKINYDEILTDDVASVADTFSQSPAFNK